MALTQEILKNNKILEGLTDEQRLAIVTLSQNDENAIIGARFSEVYRQLDDTILEATGIQRDGAEKTYNYLARATKAFAAKYADYDTLKGDNESFRTKVAELEKKIAEGSLDAESLKAFNQAKVDLEAMKRQYAELQKTHDEAMAKHESDIFGMRVDSVIDGAKSSLKFKKDMSEAMVALAVKDAVSKVKGYNPDFIDDGKGGQVLVFRNAEGATMNNPENQLNPYTAKELLVKELSSYGVLETSTPKGSGGGTPPSQPSPLGTFTTQVQANAAIAKHLASKGLTRGTSQYQAEWDKLYIENKVNSLPIGTDD